MPMGKATERQRAYVVALVEKSLYGSVEEVAQAITGEPKSLDELDVQEASDIIDELR